MGAGQSRDENNLNDTPLFCFNETNSSSGLKFDANHLKVNFPSRQDQLQVAYLNSTLRQGFIDQTLFIKAKVECKEGAIAVIGFGEPNEHQSKDALGDLYLLDITQQKVSLCGEIIPNITIPHCSNGDIIEWQIDIDNGTLHYCVHYSSDGKTSPVASFTFDSNDIPPYITPMVGMIKTGEHKSSFHILEISKKLKIPLNKEEEAKVRFDVSTAYGPVIISKDGLTVSREEIKSNCCILINRILKTGRHRWKIKVVKDIGSSLCLGLVDHPFRILQLYDNNKHPLYLHDQFYIWRSYGGLLYSHGTQLNQHLPSVQSDGSPVLIEFILDLSTKTLEIKRNDVSLGVVFNNIIPPVQPAVVFYADYEKEVQLVSFDSETISCFPVALKLPKRHIPMTNIKPAMFAVNTAHGQVIVSSDGSILERAPNQSGNAYCLLNRSCTSGVYKWSFLIGKDDGASICLGITKEPVQLPVGAADNIYMSKGMCLYRSYQGRLYWHGNELKKRFVEFWEPGTVVELVLDMENGVLQYIVNEENQGVAFGHLRNAVYRPIVAFYAGMKKSITLLKFEHIMTNTKLPISYNNLNQSEEEKKLLKDGNNQEIQRTDVSCWTCGVENENVIFLPCKHAIFCATHASADDTCIVCEQPIQSIMNVF